VHVLGAVHGDVVLDKGIDGGGEDGEVLAADAGDDVLGRDGHVRRGGRALLRGGEVG
jgi:hypothetical protein